jgi:DNA polymerase III alpha subunit
MTIRHAIQNVDCQSYPDIPELPLSVLMALERSALGFYHSRHPMDYYGSYARAFSTHRLREVEFLKSGTKMILCGVCTKLVLHKNRGTSRKKKYIIGIDDKTSVSDILLFIDQDKSISFIKPPEIGFFECHVSEYEGLKQIVLDGFTSLARSPYTYGRALVLKIDSEKSQALAKAQNEVQKFHGLKPLFFDITGIPGTKHAILKADPKFSVALSPNLAHSLIRLLGEDRVNILGRNGIAVSPVIKDIDSYEL